ncbi:hypothetical protein [Wenzhouxiangella sp. EGI_FJ10409]|uniref:hypothetical protein n=1 Tax=Wenzhouxiangella sp. EGI_FJ10409 TaxID=3243767 RepID=UPI0035DD72DD
MIRVPLLFGLLCMLASHAIGQNAAPVERDELHARVAQWMVQHDDVEMRAMGLAMLAGRETDALGGDRFIAEVERLLTQDPTAAAVYSIAHTCHERAMIEACREAGVLEAIKRLDAGNAIALGLFQEPDSQAFKETIVSATHVNDYWVERTAAWFEALQSAEVPEELAGQELVAALSIAMAWSHPVLQPMLERCEAAGEAENAGLDAACQRLASRLQESGPTLFWHSMGYAMARTRAEQNTDTELVSRLEQQQQAMMDRAACLARSDSAQETLSGEADGQRRFLEVFRNAGEIAALEFAAGEAASNCPAA